MVSQALVSALDMLFVFAAVASVAAIVWTWREVRETVFTLRDDLTRTNGSRDYRYRITLFETRQISPQVTRLLVRTRPAQTAHGQTAHGQTAPGLVWPELRAAA